MERIDVLESKGMTFWGNHGLNDDQKAVGQIFQVDIDVTLDMSNQFNEDMPVSYTHLDVYKRQVP